jgi:Zn-dependent peptidase ImmA (M78 family)/transcriptional regulator with XRE-family HTH domain
MRPILVPNEVFWGERLKVAREFRGITQAKLAEDVAASPALISLCEGGRKTDLPADLIEAFGDVLGFDRSFFFGTVDDLFREEECSFRHRRNAPERLKAQVRAHATLVGMVIKRLGALFKFPAVDVPQRSAATPEEVEAAAEHCRRHWNLGIDGPIKHIGRVLEHAGVVIVPHLVKSTKVDAFSRQGNLSVIFLNQAIQSSSRWNFDIAHECGHLVLHRGVITGTVDTEATADRFASAFLMPQRAFLREFETMPFSWKHVFDMKRRWQTSAAAIIRRAYDLGSLSAVQYRRSYQYMSAKGWTGGEPHEPFFQEPELLMSALRSLGTKVSLTLGELCGQLGFTPSTFAEVTGMQVPEPQIAVGEVIAFPERRA